MDEENKEQPKRISDNEFPIGTPRVVDDVDDFEKAPDELFTETREAIFTVNRNKIYPNAACVRMLPDVEYVEILINREKKMMALKPCDELTSGGYRWSKEKNGKRYPVPRTGLPFVILLCQAMDWNAKDRYQIKGKVTTNSKGETLVSFDLYFNKRYERPEAEEGQKRRDRYVNGWNGHFGPTYAECKRTMRVNTFNGYTVLSEESESKPGESEGVNGGVQPAD